MNLYVCASPRLEKSTSLIILNDLRRFLGDREEDRLILPLRVPGAVEERENILERMNSAENVIIAFPLYVDAWPSHLIKWMELWSRFRESGEKTSSPRVFMIANSGFPESEQNREALEIGRLFAEKTGLPWGLGIAVGMGGCYRGMAKAPLESPLKKRVSQAFHGVREEISHPSPEGRGIMTAEVAFPRWFNNFMGTRGWYREAGKNGLRKKDLYARPYPTR